MIHIFRDKFKVKYKARLYFIQNQRFFILNRKNSVKTIENVLILIDFIKTVTPLFCIIKILFGIICKCTIQ